MARRLSCRARLTSAAVSGVVAGGLAAVGPRLWDSNPVMGVAAMAAAAMAAMAAGSLAGGLALLAAIFDATGGPARALAAPLGLAAVVTAFSPLPLDGVSEARLRLDPVALAAAAVVEAYGGPRGCLEALLPLAAVGVVSRRYALPRPLLWLLAAAAGTSPAALAAVTALLAGAPLEGVRGPLCGVEAPRLVEVYGRWTWSRGLLPGRAPGRSINFACARVPPCPGGSKTVLYLVTVDARRALECLGLGDSLVLCPTSSCAREMGAAGFRVAGPEGLPVLEDAGHRALPYLASRAPTAERVVVYALHEPPGYAFWESVSRTVGLLLDAGASTVVVASPAPPPAPVVHPPATVALVACCAGPRFRPWIRLKPVQELIVSFEVVRGHRALYDDGHPALIPCKRRGATRGP